MGDNDKETLLNIAKCNWDFNDPSFDHISAEAKNFITMLLKKDVSQRMTVEEALEHPWLNQNTTRLPQDYRLATAKHRVFWNNRPLRVSFNTISETLKHSTYLLMYRLN